MLATLCTLPCYFVHNYLVVRLLAITMSTHLPLLLYTLNINLFGIVYSALHGAFLKQARAGLRPARSWFLKIDPVRIVSMHVCVCVSVPEAINN